MRTRCHLVSGGLIAAALMIGVCALNADAQVASSRITQPISDSQLATLRGNIHPLARPEYDRGLAPSSLPLGHVMLLLKRSPQQEASLEALLAAQQDRNSPNFHHWLTPAQFGAEFGPSDQDMQAIEAWLEAHGFSVDRVSAGRTVIEFSGSAGEVQSAFHAEIHRYVLPSGEQHWANSADPQIPAALAPVVAGIRSLNDFHPRPLSRAVLAHRSPQALSQTNPRPSFTFQASGPCSFIQSLPGAPPPVDICFMVTPADFGKIYNVQPLWSAGTDGAGETIAIPNDSNVNLTDVSSFRSVMGLPAKSPQVILANGTDPRLTGDETEAVLDVEWSGAIAPNATIDLVIAPSTNTTFGGDVAAEYIIDGNLAPILSYSFGACEAAVGNFYQSLWQQAAAEGITVLAASGDNGSAGCDAPPSTADTPQPAKQGLAVSGLASTQYDVAVGGTDFDDVSNPCQFWSSCNPPGTSPSASSASALGYIPETTWNESCTNPVFWTPPLNANFSNATAPEAACNNPTLEMPGTGITSFVIASGGSGGVSTQYSKPAWQNGVTPSDGQRDLPDVSLFAGTGAIAASFYYLCQSDLSNPPQTCSLNGAIDGVGGTSVSAQVMAGIVALIDQQARARQGNINPALYQLYGTAKLSSEVCASAANPNSNCIFYDVTAGGNAMPCAFSSTAGMNSPNCFASTSTDKYGILSTSTTQLQPGYNAGVGYDLATGLGSINAQNLVLASNAWTAGPSTTADFSMGPSNATVTLGSNNKGSMQITITPQNGFTGSVNLSCPGLPAADSCSFNPASPVAVNGVINVTVTVAGTVATVPGSTNRPAVPAGWPLRTEILVAFACFAALLFFGAGVRRRRWNPALAFLAVALFVIAGCSGGSAGSPSGNTGSGGAPAGSPFMTTVMATTCSAAAGPGCAAPGITHSLVFTIQ
ncbi:MAG: S53 family peptidase [Acidobacteriota bacterium]|nr:S53 family peptidase [Acidobacteriota bacterium]